MMHALKEYRRKPWPKLEVPYFRLPQVVGLAIYTFLLVVIGGLIFTGPETRVIQFALLGLAIPILFIVKSPFTTIIGLLTFEVIVSFLFLGNPAYAIGSVIALAGAIIAFESPILMYMLLLLAVWFDNSLLQFGYSNMAKFIIGTALIIGWMFKHLSHRREGYARIYFPEKWPALLFLGWVSLGYLMWCFDAESIGWLHFKLLILSVLFLMISPLVMRNNKLLDLGVYAWIVAGVISSLATLYALKMGFSPAGTDVPEGLAVLTARKNVTAYFLTLSIFPAVGALYWVKGFRRKLALLLIIGLLTITLIMLESRGAAGSFILGLGIFWLADTFFGHANRNPLRMLARSFAFVSVIVLVNVAVFRFNLAEHLQTYSDLFNFSTSASMQFREEMFGMSMEMIQKEGHWIRGLGVGAFQSIGVFYGSGYGFGSGETIASWGLAFNSHSLFLDILLHYGVVGLLLFLWLILLNLRNTWRNFISAEEKRFRYLFLVLFCCLVSYYAHGLIDGQLSTQTDLWLYIGLAVAANSIYRQRPKSTALVLAQKP